MKRFFSRLFERLDDLLFPVLDDEDELRRLQREARRLQDENDRLRRELAAQKLKRK